MPTPSRRATRRRALEPAFALARAQVDRGTLPWAILGVADRSGTIRLEAIARDGAHGPAVDAVCLLASITKPIVATAVMHEVEAGRIHLATPLHELDPGLGGTDWDGVTVWHVLTHTAGIEDIDLEAILRHVGGRADLLGHVRKGRRVTAPGSTFRYATFTFDILAECVGRALGEPFEAVIARTVLDPLGMAATTFDPRPDPGLAARAAPVIFPGDEETDGGPGDEGADLLAAYTGLRLMGGGLWSSAQDLLRFGRAMLRGGELDGARILSPASVRLTTREVTTPRTVTSGGLGTATDPLEASHYAIGWGKPGIHSIGSAGAFGHGGGSGTRLWVDPEVDLAYVFLSGRWGLPTAPIDALEHAIYAGLSGAG